MICANCKYIADSQKFIKGEFIKTFTIEDRGMYNNYFEAYACPRCGVIQLGNTFMTEKDTLPGETEEKGK